MRKKGNDYAWPWGTIMRGHGERLCVDNFGFLLVSVDSAAVAATAPVAGHGRSILADTLVQRLLESSTFFDQRRLRSDIKARERLCVKS